jgi:hypothetical protein
LLHHLARASLAFELRAVRRPATTPATGIDATTAGRGVSTSSPFPALGLTQRIIGRSWSNEKRGREIASGTARQ